MKPWAWVRKPAPGVRELLRSSSWVSAFIGTRFLIFGYFNVVVIVRKKTTLTGPDKFCQPLTLLCHTLARDTYTLGNRHGG